MVPGIDDPTKDKPRRQAKKQQAPNPRKQPNPSPARKEKAREVKEG